MRVVVPISEEPSSRAAIAAAAELVADDDEVILASVGELPETSTHQADIRSALEGHLAAAVEVARAIGLEVRTRIELAGDPVRGIIQVAREEGADRIVIASEEQGPLESLVDRSVAEDLQESLSGIEVVVVPRG